MNREARIAKLEMTTRRGVRPVVVASLDCDAAKACPEQSGGEVIVIVTGVPRSDTFKGGF